MNNRPLTGQKRPRPVIDDERNVIPRKRQNTEVVERIDFACLGGDGRRNKVNDYIAKCRRKETSPVTCLWDKEKFLKTQKEDSQGFKELLRNDETEFREVISTCKRKSGCLYCKPCDSYFLAVQQTDKNYRLQLVGRHIKTDAHQKHTRGQEGSNDLVFTKEEEEYITRLQLTFCAKTNQSMSIFSKQTQERAPELTKIWEFLVTKASNGRMNPKSVDQLLTDRSKLIRRIPQVSTTMQVYLKTYLPIVADHGYVDVIADHRHNGNYQSDAEKKCFGFGISIPDGEDKKCPLLLEYRPTNDAGKEITMAIMDEFLNEWNLMDAFKQNKITFSVDCCLFTTARDLYTKKDLIPRVNICVPHNFGRNSKRSMNENLVNYWPDGPTQIKECDKIISKTRKECADYFKFTPIDQSYLPEIGPLLRKNYTEGQKVVKYKAIPENNPVRFRNTRDRYKLYMSWLPELKAIKADETHELNQKVTEIFPSNEKLELIQDIQEFSDEMIVFVDFFESNQNYQCVDVLNAYSYAFHFACNILPSYPSEKKALRLALLDSLTEQCFGGKMDLGDNDEYLWEVNPQMQVRINDLHKTAAFFYYGDRKLNLQMVKKSLMDLQKRFSPTHLIAKKAKALLDHVVYATSSWQADAIKFIKDMDKALNPDQYYVNHQNLNRNESDDEYEMLHDLSQNSDSLFPDEQEPFQYDTQFRNASWITQTQETQTRLSEREAAIDKELQKWLNTDASVFIKCKYNERMTPHGKIVQLYWQSERFNMPILSALVSNIINIPASSSIIERCFGTISGMLTKAKNRTCARNLLFYMQVKQFDEIKRAITSRGIIHGFHVEDPEVFVPEHCDTFETENGLHEIL